MKPLSIAEYLDHLGPASVEKAPPRRESSPFRPRTLPGLAGGEPRSPPAFARQVAGAGDQRREEMPRPTPWDRKPSGVESTARQLQPPREAAKPDDIAVRLAEAHARGRDEGLAEGRAEASDRRAAELAAGQQEALAEREEFQRNEYARLEGAIRSGLRQIEAALGASVTRILAPFLEKQVVKQAADELCAAVARICAGGSPGLMTIRGPERVLALMRERIADLPVVVDFVVDKGPEAVVEANVTQVATELRSWAELLASLDA